MHNKALVLITMSFLSSCAINDTSPPPKIHKVHKSLEGTWVVSHAEVIEVPDNFLNNSALKQCEELAKKYQYDFFDSGRFARFIPGRKVIGSENMQGHYEIDTVKKQIVWYWEHSLPTGEDTVRFNYLTVNPFKIVMVEPNGVYNVLTVLSRAEDK